MTGNKLRCLQVSDLSTKEERMWYEVSYVLRTLDDAGPEVETRRFSSPCDEFAGEMGRAIANSRSDGINRRGGLASVSGITVKRVRKPEVKRPR